MGSHRADYAEQSKLFNYKLPVGLSVFIMTHLKFFVMELNTKLKPEL